MYNLQQLGRSLLFAPLTISFLLASNEVRADIFFSVDVSRFDDGRFALQTSISSNQAGNPPSGSSYLGPDGTAYGGEFGSFEFFSSIDDLLIATAGNWTLTTTTESTVASLASFSLSDFPDYLVLENPNIVQNPFSVETNIDSQPVGTIGLLTFASLGPGIAPEFANLPFTNPIMDGSILNVPFEQGVSSSFIDFNLQTTIGDNGRITGSNLSPNFNFNSFDLSGNRLTVIAAAVPEPSSIALLTFASVVAGCRRRRQRIGAGE